MYNVSNAILPNKTNSLLGVRLNPFVIPEDGEPPIKYITALKVDAPFEYYTIGGINFEKSVMPSEATYRDNYGKQFYPQYLAKLLTKKQADAIKQEALHRHVVIHTLKNLGYDPRKPNDPDNLRYMTGGTFCLADYLILEPESSFNPKEYPSKTPVVMQANNPVVTPDEMRGALIDQQKQPPKGNRK